jgi:diguanylate cyclase (GGDEF)-like protein
LSKHGLKKELIDELGNIHSNAILGKMEAEKKSLIDPLTGLGNLANLKAVAQPILVPGRRGERQQEKRKHSLIRIDLDDFKKINDTYGHSAGDRVLVEVAKAIKATLRKEEKGLAYRKGGDEFVVFLPHANLEIAAKVAERIRENIEKVKIKSEKGDEIKVTASLGCSSTEQVPKETPRNKYLEALDENSDAAAYRSKESGRNKVSIFESKIKEKESSS